MWFADDAAAGDSLLNLHEWWTALLRQGPSFGYHPNPAKTWLIVKEGNLDQATNIFGSSGVNITSSGQKHLGAALGSTEFVKKFVKKKVAKWCEEVICLSTIAKREPQAAYAAFVHGVIHLWNYILKTIPNISELLTPLEEAIRYQLIPAITGRSTVSDTERDVLALPCRLGGMGLINPVKLSMLQYE